jgi:hypothetical protein
MKIKLLTLVIVVALGIVVPINSSMAFLIPTQYLNVPTGPTVPTVDKKNEQKEVAIVVPYTGGLVKLPSLDTIGIFFAKLAIERIFDSTIKWINGGFEGNPAFISDPNGFFLNIADGIAGDYIYGSDVGFLCSPFQSSLRLSLALNYSLSTGRYNRTSQCTLSGIIDNVDDFYTDFSKGGWDSWFQVTQNPSYNPYSGYLAAENELTSRIAAAVGAENQKLDWGKGFLSRPGDCVDFGDLGNGTDGCREYAPDKTPGVVIEGQLENVLGTGVRQLELADEFDELINALLSQLLQRTIFGGEGLVSSKPYQVKGGSGEGGGTIGSPDEKQYEGPDPDQPPVEQPPVIVPGVFACGPNPVNTSVGGTITWSVFDGTGYPSVFVWSGEGVQGMTGVSVSATYSTVGTKTVSVTAVPTDGVTLPETVTCMDATIGSSPLIVSCSPANTYVSTVGQAIQWDADISGGSGTYTSIIWDGDENTLADGSNAWEAYTPQIIKSGNTTTVEQLRVYYETGLKMANVSVTDSSGSTISSKLCSAGIQVN